MHIADAQREVRLAYMGGGPGLLISSAVWFLAAAGGSWLSWNAAMWILLVGGALIFFLLELLLRLAGHRPERSQENSLNPLTLQLAILMPLMLPLIVAAFWYRADWLFPAFMAALGAHFLPFMFLFGNWQFGVLGVLLSVSALVFGLEPHESFVVAGWYGGTVQLLFGLIAWSAWRREAGPSQ